MHTMFTVVIKPPVVKIKRCPVRCLQGHPRIKFDYEMVHSKVYLNKYVVSIAPFSTPACPDCSQNCSFSHVFAS